MPYLHMPTRIALIFCFLLTVLTGRADVIISEFLASNTAGLTDEDGETSDWIELYNDGTATVDLTGWRLTDDAADSAKWVFPAVNLEPKGFLVVFASSKNRRNLAANLHTNFKLAASGGYLGLFRQDGSPATVFAAYAAQYPDRSFGTLQTVATTTYLATNASLKYLVPADDALGATWTARTFSDAAWPAGTNGVGFESQTNGWLFKYFKSSGTIGNLAQAEAVIASPSGQTSQSTTATFNFINSGSNGHYTGDITPGPLNGSAIDHYVVEGTGVITIPTAGVWSFGVNSDDGSRTQIDLNKDGDFNDAGETVSDDVISGAHDFIRQFTFPTAGDYSIRAVVFQSTSGSEGEVFARPGTFNSWTADFKLAGDTAGGGLVIRSAPPVGGSGILGMVGTNLLGSMANAAPKKSSAFLRYGFNVPSAAAVASLTMRVNYEDGFVAYLNGTEVARRNVPAGSLAYNSLASSDRATAQALIAETVDLSPFVGALVNGTNVLVIHGLNDAAASGDFLIRPQLSQFVVSPGASSNLTTPTPRAFNVTTVYNKVAPVIVSVGHGFYSTPQSVALSTATAGATIYYSFDGSEPSSTSPTSAAYTAPITINKTTTLRYRAQKAGAESSSIFTQTYLFTADIKNQSANSESAGGTAPVIVNPTGATTPTTAWPGGGNVNGQVLDYGMDTDIVNSPTYGPQIEGALKAIPSFSIVTDLNNLFDTATGIYVNPGLDELASERSASVELIYPDGKTGFQANCGLRLRGGFSRSGGNPKHSFRFLFRESYGPAKLDFPLFGSDPTAATTFYKFDLRTAQNYSWSFGGDASNFFVQDQFSRITQLAMGQISSHSLHAHVYVNGQYWGLFNVDERPEANFGAVYFGGDADNFDTVKHDTDIGRNIEATDGNLTAWTAFWTLADQMNAGTGDAVYQQMQGKNPNGTPNAAYPVYLDPSNLMDEMIIIYWTANLDAIVSAFFGNESCNNTFAFRDRTGGSGGWKFVLHDSEHTLRDNLLDTNRLGPSAGNGWPAGDSAQQGANAVNKSGGQYICTQLLKYSADFRAVWADRVYKHLFNTGALSVPVAQARLEALKSEILLPMIAESARWGDSKNADPRTQANFITAIDGVRNNFLANRTPILISQLQTWGWYPTVLPPTLSQRGGNVSSGFALTLSNPNGGGTIYYTLDGSDPRTNGGAVAGTAIPYTGAIPINLSRIVRARVLLTGTWSPLDEATFYTGGSFDSNQLIVSEIHYNPLPDGATDGDEYEFLELRNVGGTTLDLGGLNFSNGITFAFTPGTTLAPNAHFLLVRNAAKFAERYPAFTPRGVYTGRLDNSGERLTLLTASGSTVFDFSFDDVSPWPLTADGLGSSLVPVVPTLNPTPGDPASWRGSSGIGGSPGADDPALGIPGIIINEVLTNSTLPLTDSIELYNPTASPVAITDWWLSDDSTVPKKYRIPATTIPAGSYVSFTEAQFNPTPGLGTSFSFSSNGEQACLFSGDASGNLTGYARFFTYQAADENVSFGRHVNSVGEESFPAQSARTPGAGNAGPQIGPLVINEIQYFPAVGLDEYVEIRNVSASAVNLWDPANPTNTWKLTGLDFVFPANTTIPAGGYALIVGLSPSAFRTKYAIPASVQIFATAGILNNSGQRLTLEKPAPPYVNGAQTVVPFVIVDSVRYSSVAPWQSGAAGGGSSLQRSSGSSFADDPANWGTGGLTPGAPNVINQVPSIALTNPPPGASYILPSVLEFSTTASDPDGVVTKVEFFSGSTLIGTDTTAPFSFAWTSFTTGSHTITARATDNSFGTTTSAPVTIQVTGTGTGGAGTGWYAQYYKDSNGTTHLVDPPLGTRTDATLNFNSTAGWPNNFVPGVAPTGTLFSGRWSGRLLAPATGTFNFYTGSADGIRLFINGQLLINHWTDHAYTTHAAALALTAGQFYDIVVEYYQNLGDAVLRLDYECTAAGIARQVIPAARVYPAGAPLLLARPGPVTLSSGQTIGFNVLATGGGALTYQWQRNNVNIAGATGTSLLLQDPLATQAGTYRVIVTNAMGSTTSGSAGLAIPDTDGDSIPDYWETQNGLNPAVANPGDTDGDGASDVAEYLAGTHPQNAASHLTLSVIQGTVPVTNYRLSFTGQSNRSYSLQYKNTLSAPTWSPLHQIPAANGLRALKFIDPAAGQAERYYRVITPLE